MDVAPVHLTPQQLTDGLAHVRAAPADDGELQLIVARPEVLARQVLPAAELDPVQGLVGDTWLARGYRKRPDGSAHPDMQITFMNARAAQLVAGDQQYWPLFGDQLYVDLDVSHQNLPPGTRLLFGTAELEVTAEPHTGCAKFAERFGRDALLFVNGPEGAPLRLRGVNSRVVRAGTIRVGDRVRKVATDPSI